MARHRCQQGSHLCWTRIIRCPISAHDDHGTNICCMNMPASGTLARYAAATVRGEHIGMYSAPNGGCYTLHLSSNGLRLSLV